MTGSDRAGDARVAALVHELRSPLVVVEGFAGVLAGDDGRLTQEQRADFARRIASAAAELRERLDAEAAAADG